MKYLVISERGDFSGAALRLVKEGNDVRMWMKMPRSKRRMEGIIEQVSSVQEGMTWGPDVVVFDVVGFGPLADKMRRDGHRVVGGGSFHDRLELDRSYGIKAMETFGIGAPATYAFPNLKEAGAFALHHNKLLVLKPNDNKSTALTYVSKSNDELIAYLAYLRGKGIDFSCVLQDFVRGTEISTEVWYANGKPIPFPNSTVEVKRFLPEDLGPSTGSQASMVWAYPKREPRIVQKTLKKLGILLEKNRYSGPLDINGIIRNGRFFGLGFTPRFGYNSLYAWTQLLGEDLGAVLHRIGNGDTTALKLREGFGASLRCSVPPYPFESPDPSIQAKVYEATRGQYVGGVEKDAWGRTVFPLDITSTKAGLVTAGFDGIIAEVCGSGQNVFQAYDAAAERFKKIELPNKQARLGDIANRTMQVISDLEYQGFEMPPMFGRSPVVEAPPLPKEAPIIKEKTHESTKVPVPAHMSTTTVSMPAKLS